MRPMKKVLVTGLGGFIGRRCVPFLLEKGYEVHGVGRGRKPDFIDDQVEWRRLDLLDLNATAACVRELCPTHLLNLAWYTVHGKYWRAPENFKWVQAGLNLLISFSEADGKRFVGAGSCAEYDWNYGFLSEDLTPRVPHSPFGRCKNALYEASASLGEVSGVSFAWGRVFFVYGPHENGARLVPSVITSLLSGRRARCSHGNQIRDFSHVDDVAAAFVALLDSDVTGGVNIASGWPVSLKTLISMIAEKIERPDLVELGALPTPENDPPMLAADVRKLRNDVGVSPIYDLDSGITATIEFHRGQSARSRDQGFWRAPAPIERGPT